MSILVCGLCVGAVMTIPGMSGGTAAMLLGIYDKTVKTVSRIFSEPAKSLMFLMKFSTGAFAGILIFSWLLDFLLDTPAGLPLRFFFLGAVAGSIPMLLRQADARKITPCSVALLLAGAGAAVMLSSLPEGSFSPEHSGISGVISGLLGGILLAIALVLPGISASHLLYILGIYDEVLENISRLDILPLIPMAAGIIIGIFFTAKALEALFERHRSGTFLVILGFIIASLHELIPDFSSGIQLIIGIICASAGFLAAFLIQDKEKTSVQRSL